MTENGCQTDYEVNIDGESYHTDDPILTGNQLLKLVKKKSKDSIVYELLDDGEMEQISPTETTDLRKYGVEKYITFDTDRVFRFQLNDVGLEWGAPQITGKALKKLAGVNHKEHDLWQYFDDSAPVLIKNKDMVSFTPDGVEEFKTRPAKKKTVTVYYSGDHTPFEIEKGKYTTEQLLNIFDAPEGYILQLIVDGEFVTLAPGETIKIKKDMEFISHAPMGASS